MRAFRGSALLGIIALVLILPTESAAASRRQIAARSPHVASGAGEATSAVRAVVTVTVDPQGASTGYTVQYGTSTDYSQTTAIKTVSATSGRQRYQIALHGLVPSTVYHYRVVAANVYGSTLGRDESFGTWPAVQIAFGSRGVISKNNITSKPRGSRRNRAPIGWVMAIHGGGWQYVGPLAVRAEQARTRFFTRLGWAADNVDYRKGEHSLPDVLAAYDALRRRVGSKTPICVIGQSAGGTSRCSSPSIDRLSTALSPRQGLPISSDSGISAATRRGHRTEPPSLRHPPTSISSSPPSASTVPCSGNGALSTAPGRFTRICSSAPRHTTRSSRSAR